MKTKTAAKSRRSPGKVVRTLRSSRKTVSASEASDAPKRILASIYFAKRSNGHLLLLHMVEAFPIRRQIAEVAKNEAADLLIVPTQKT